ncbi:MAG: hypothetical protein K0Q49_530 [Haloplasmataceae bacterium]|jgi:ribosomal protein L5|nr:hypothetical protein [Haloplasmataceae bacterium]
MNSADYKLNLIYSSINFNEQLILNKRLTSQNIFKVKNNFYIKNIEKNKFLLVTNILLLERAAGQRVIFVKDRTDTPRVKPVKVGCSVSLRDNNMFSFWKILIYFSFPKLYEVIFLKNNNFDNQNLIFINLNHFLFISSFSFSNDFDRFLLFYEDFRYYLSMEFYSGFHKFLISQPLLSLHGLKTL